MGSIRRDVDARCCNDYLSRQPLYANRLAISMSGLAWVLSSAAVGQIVGRLVPHVACDGLVGCGSAEHLS